MTGEGRWWRRWWARGLVRRVITYSLGSAVAAVTGEASFVAVYGWLAAGNVAASAAGFAGGAVPNYVVNRWFVWGDRRGRRTRSELILYWAVALASLGCSVAVTGAAEGWAAGLSDDRAWRVTLVAAAYLAVAAVFFVAKFAAFHFVVFTATAPAAGAGTGGPSPAATTRSRG